jgi:hypothetical protein
MDYIVNLDYVTVAIPQTTGKPEKIHIRLEKSGYNRHGEYILRQAGLKGKNYARKGNISLLIIVLLLRIRPILHLQSPVNPV